MTRGNPANAGTRRPIVPRAHVVAEWEWLHETGELSSTDSMRARIALAAPRINMTAPALEKALARAGIRNPVEPSFLPPRRPNLHADCGECRKFIHLTDQDDRDVRQIAKRLAADPDSLKLRALLGEAQESQATTKAYHDAHLDYDHDETEQVAA